jgi:assimilatory nitrate reductase catalytic subunit
VLTTDRILRQYQNGTQTRRIPSLAMTDCVPLVELHPDLARRHGIGAGDQVELRTRRGCAVFRAHLTDTVRPDTVFTPFHWGSDSSANALTDPPSAACPRCPASRPARSRSRGCPSHPGRTADMPPTPRFLQGVYPFKGNGLEHPQPVAAALSYTVPDGVTAQAVYFRAGNSADDLVCVVLMRDGRPMRYFPVGAKADMHVPLRVVEDLDAGTRLELHLAAPEGVTGTVVIDLGLLEV